MTDEIDTAANSDANQTQQDDANKAGDAAAAEAAKAGDANKAGDPPAAESKKTAEELAAADAAKAVAAKAEADATKPNDDWRVRLAGGDEKELKRLSRFASEADVYKAYRELEKKKSSGELKQALAKDASPEELAQWRKDNGIPESADKYDLTFDNGIVIGEADKPGIDRLVSNLHGTNATHDQVKAAVATYYEILGEQQQALAEQDVAFKDQSLESLRDEWGGDFKKNLNAVNGFLASLPDDVRESFDNARTPDGRVLGNDPSIIKWLAATAFEINPAVTVMPASVTNPGAAIGDEITSIEKLIGDKSSSYWKGPEASKMQNRYLELITARDKIAQRA